MPKLKTKSSIKKRFHTTSSGKIICTQAGKRHGMRKRSNDMLRSSRGTTIMKKCDAQIIGKFMPYGI